MKNLTIDGHIGENPVKHTTAAGRNYLTFSVAVKSYEKNENVTEWFGITDYNVEDEKRLHKGDYVLIQAKNFKASVNVKDGKAYLNQNAIASNINVLIRKKIDEAVGMPNVYEDTNKPVAAEQPAAVKAEVAISTGVEGDLPF